MTYNSNFNFVFAQSTDEESHGSHYGPSVPIAVYRQLAEELKITQTRLKFAEQENRKLVQQNQQLKQELADLIKQGADLKQLVANFEFTVNYPLPNTESKVRDKKQEITEISQPIKPKNKTKKLKTRINRSEMIEELLGQNSPQLSRGKFKETNGPFLAIAIIFILLTTFGAGFLVIHSYSSNNNR